LTRNEVSKLVTEKDNIDTNRGLAENDMADYVKKIDNENDERSKQDAVDQNNAADEQAKV